MQDGRSRYLLPAVLAAAALVVGLLLGRLSESESSDGDASRARRDPGPTDVRNGVPIGYSRTRQGAVAAVLNYAVVQAPLVTKPKRERDAVIRALGTASYVERATRELDRAVVAGRAAPLSRDLRAGVRTVYVGAPLAYRVVGWTPREATIALWSAGVVASAAGVGPGATFQTARTVLHWERDDWRVARVSRRDSGPTPSITGEVTPPGLFVEALEQLEVPSYGP